MNKLIINDQLSFDIKQQDHHVVVDSEPHNVDLKKISDRHYHLLIDNHSFSAELVSIDYKTRQAIIKVNQTEFSVMLKDGNDALLEKLGMNINATQQQTNLKAPMPGLVLDILVNPNDHVRKGDGLLILEAMKMENLIKAPADLNILSINIQKGDKVEKNQVLLDFELSVE